MGWTVYNSDGKVLQSAELGDSSVTSAKIADGAIVAADINASAAIAYTQLAALTDGNILVGNGSDVAVSVNPTGDIGLSNAGAFSITAGAVVDADVNTNAAIAYTKLAALADGNILVGNGSNVAVSVSPSGDIDVSNAGVLSLNSTAISGFSAKTSIADADTILLGDSAASGALKKMTKANFVSGLGGAALTGTTATTLVTVASANNIQGEANLTYTGNYLSLKGAADDSTSSGIHWGTSADTTLGTLEYDTLQGQFKLMVNNKAEVLKITNARLHAKFNSSGTSSFYSGSDDLIIENNASTGITIATPNNVNSFWCHATPTGGSQTSGFYTAYNSGTPYFAIMNDGGERFKITGSDVTGAHGSYHTSSDARIKENVVDITYGLNAVMAMRPVEYDFCDWYNPDIPDKTRLGFIAQEVKVVVPEVVNIATDPRSFQYKADDDTPVVETHETIEDMHSIEEQQIIPILVKAIQELNAKIDALGI